MGNAFQEPFLCLHININSLQETGGNGFQAHISLPFFPVPQANSNEIVLASTHDVQEVDVSNLVSVQPFTWIGEDFDKESRR